MRLNLCELITIYNIVILVLSAIKSKNFITRRAEIIVFVRVRVLFQWLFLDQTSFETKQKLKYEVYFNFIFISIKKNILEIS